MGKKFDYCYNENIMALVIRSWIAHLLVNIVVLDFVNADFVLAEINLMKSYNQEGIRC